MNYQDADGSIKPIASLPWWKKDAQGWPIEIFRGRPVINFFRYVFQNLRKLKGKK